MRYATYQDYTDIFHGGAIAEVDFTRLEDMAADYIDYATRDRAENVTDPKLLLKIRKAVCAVAEIIQKGEAADLSTSIGSEDKEIVSEAIDGVSVSYARTSTDTFSAEGKEFLEESKYDIVKQYLGRTGLMYAGVGR